MNPVEQHRVRSAFQKKEVLYRLVGEICEGCGQAIFPPRDLCPKCESQVLVVEENEGQLKVVFEAARDLKKTSQLG